MKLVLYVTSDFLIDEEVAHREVAIPRWIIAYSNYGLGYELKGSRENRVYFKKSSRPGPLLTPERWPLAILMLLNDKRRRRGTLTWLGVKP